MKPLYEAALDALAPLQRMSLLDAGCGAGLALQLAALRGAVVTGLDATAALLEVAQQRTPEAQLHVGDIESLPYDEATFDIVTAFNSIQYANDPAAAVAELARVCSPGGRIAIGIWGAPQRCETEALFARLRSLAPPPPGTKAPLACSEPGVVESLLSRVGATIIDSGETICSFVFPDTEAAFQAHRSAGPVQKVIDLAGEQAVRRTITDVVEADRKPDGQLRQDNVFRFVIARTAAG
jgi:SAM-dependent methyltransferase